MFRKDVLNRLGVELNLLHSIKKIHVQLKNPRSIKKIHVPLKKSTFKKKSKFNKKIQNYNETKFNFEIQVSQYVNGTVLIKNLLGQNCCVKNCQTYLKHF